MKPLQQLTVSLSEKIALKRAGRLATVPSSSRKLFERVWEAKASPRACIKAFCQECVGFERAAIKECAAYACPLWNLRPHRAFSGAGSINTADHIERTR